MQLSNLLGQDAIALGTAERVGTVKGIGIEGSRIVSVQLSDTTISATAVRSFEGQVLTFDETVGNAGLSPVATGDPRGRLVLDTNGDGLGSIVDLVLTGDGDVETVVLTDDRTVPGPRLKVIGSFAAIVGGDLPPPSGPPAG